MFLRFMTIQTSPLLLLALLTGCSSEKGVTVHNTAPNMTITAPVDGSSFIEGELITFEATVNDGEQAANTLTVYWAISDHDGALSSLPPESDGTVSLSLSTLSLGKHIAQLQVVDDQSESSTASVTVEIVEEVFDLDGDGFTEEDGDCDDADGEVYPGADEVCDEVDNDCDGDIDEDDAADAETFYTDADEDGFGDPSDSTTRCEAPSGTVSVAGDCDDSEPDAWPGNPEVCDEIDNDCDGDIDEDATDASTWYSDGDSDGYGDADSTTDACEAPSGYVTDATDCDDAEAAANPGESEVCDEIDNDCDEQTDEDVTTTWYLDDDGDGYGDVSSTTDACSQPTGYVADATDCDDTEAAANPGESEVCDEIDNDCDGTTDEGVTTTFYADADGDGFGDADTSTDACEAPTGYVADTADCDDGDSTINPDEEEVCDGDDNDCDGTTDDDATDQDTFYADADGDGYGDPDDAVSACEVPTGYVADDTDCDDSESAANPGEVEVCDEIDNDCDGTTDEGVTTTWYFDYDADGFGDASRTTEDCSQPSGYVADSTDCDDTDSAISPDGTEVCDSADNDCDGTIDEDDATDADTFYADDDGDGFGDVDTTTLSCTAPTGYVADATDCDDTDSAINPDAEEICSDGIDNNCDGDAGDCGLPSGGVLEDEADAILLGESSGDYSGEAVASAGDVNGDGLDDLLVGAWEEDSGANFAGATYLVLGTPSGTSSLSSANARMLGVNSGDSTGHAVGSGDLDGDGYSDLVIGGWGYDAGATRRGVTYTVHGPISGDLDLSSADGDYYGADTYEYAGFSVGTLGDQNGDGEAELLVGAYGEANWGTETGAVFLFFGPATSSYTTGSANVAIHGEAAGDRAAYDMDRAGDQDGDGVDDLVIGAPLESTGGTDAGAAYLVLGPLTTTGGTATHRLSIATAKYTGSTGDEAGTAVAGGGDINDDGYADLIVGAPTPSEAYVLYGPHTGTSGLSVADATLSSADTADACGGSVAGPGDIDGDGTDDVLIGCSGNDEEATGAGAAYVWYGPVTGAADTADADVALYGGASGDSAGIDVAGAGDVDGDGTADVLVGASLEDSAASDAGATYLLLGGGL